MAAVQIKGREAMLRNLAAIEKKYAPAAMANALNSTQTRVRKQVIGDAVAANPKRPKRQIGKWVRRGRRAKAPTNLVAEVTRQTPRQNTRIKGVPVSASFVSQTLGGHTYVRALSTPAGYRGKGWSRDRSQSGGVRPRTSSPNLPLFRVSTSSRDRAAAEARSDSVRRTLERSLVQAAEHQMRTFLPGEFRRHLDRRVSRINARRR